MSVLSTVAFTTPMAKAHGKGIMVATISTITSSSSSLQASPGDFPPEEAEEYTGTIDWDAEWKKVVASEGKTPDGTARPGKDFYKSEAEIAAIKAANKVAEGAVEASSRVANSLPDIRSLSGDWKVGS